MGKPSIFYFVIIMQFTWHIILQSFCDLIFLNSKKKTDPVIIVKTLKNVLNNWLLLNLKLKFNKLIKKKKKILSSFFEIFLCVLYIPSNHRMQYCFLYGCCCSGWFILTYFNWYLYVIIVNLRQLFYCFRKNWGKCIWFMFLK